jgi:hypothetical protein
MWNLVTRWILNARLLTQYVWNSVYKSTVNKARDDANTRGYVQQFWHRRNRHFRNKFFPKIKLLNWCYYYYYYYHRCRRRRLWIYSPLVDLARLFSFLICYIVGGTPWTGNQSVARPLPAHGTAHTQNKCTQTSMPRVRFEPTIAVFEPPKTAHALDCAATVIGVLGVQMNKSIRY